MYRLSKLYGIILLFLFFLCGCGERDFSKIVVGTSADYPPFEYMDAGKIQGFDIDLMNLVAERLKLKIEYKDMQFSSLFSAINSGQLDVVISSVARTEERMANFDISISYFSDGIALVFNNNKPIKGTGELSSKKVAAQLGSTMELWFEKKFPGGKLVLVNTNNQGIESLKSNQIDAMVVNVSQANEFVRENKDLSFLLIEEDLSDLGYGIVGKKNSTLIPEINKIIKELKLSGKINELTQKWIK